MIKIKDVEFLKNKISNYDNPNILIKVFNYDPQSLKMFFFLV